jgi:2,5-diketo-D-gluconate reductase A
VPRAEVFVTTKCPPDDAGKELDTLQRSLDLLGTDHLDLWLIHWPTEQLDRTAMWRAFIDAREQGLVRDIGVSNFDAPMLDELLEETGVKPAVNQIEWSPLLFDRTVLEDHRSRGVVLEGYSALRNGAMDDPTIRRTAESLGRTPAQVIMRWHLQHGVVVIPKSVTPDRIRANADVAGFELSDDQMAAIDALGGAADGTS